MNNKAGNVEERSYVRQDGTWDVETDWWTAVNVPNGVSLRFDYAPSRLTVIPAGTNGVLRRFGRSRGEVEFERYGTREVDLSMLRHLVSQHPCPTPELA